MADSNYTIIAGRPLLNEAVALIEPERSALRQLLCERDSHSVRQAMVEAYSRLDHRIDQAIASSGLYPACHSGCAWCCHGVKVNVTAPEALLIAHRLKDDAELSRAATTAAQRRRNLDTNQMFMAGDPCPFLSTSGQCQIYAVRPIACRRHCCLDANECEQAVKQPALKLPVSQHAPAYAAGVVESLALAAAIEDAGLDYRTFELTQAVVVASQTDVPEQWAMGQPVFDQAVRPVDDLDRAIAAADLNQ